MSNDVYFYFDNGIAAYKDFKTEKSVKSSLGSKDNL